MRRAVRAAPAVFLARVAPADVTGLGWATLLSRANCAR